MKIIVNNEETQNKTLEYSESFWTGKKELIYNSTPLTKVKNGVYEYNNGEQKEQFIIKGNQTTGLSITMFGNTIELVKKLTWYEITFSLLVFIPCILFGAVGGFIGGALGTTNMFVIKRIDNIYLKILISVGFAAVALLSSYLLAVLVLKAFTLI